MIQKHNKKVMFIIFAVITLIIMGFGISYAIYAKIILGNSNSKLVAGDIYLRYINGDSKNITLIPSDTYRENEYFEWTVEGKNDSNKNIIYSIVLNHGNDLVNPKKRLDDKFLRFRLVSVENDVEAEIFNDQGYQSINNTEIYVDSIPKKTSSYSEVYRLYVWVSGVIIGNTPERDYTMEEWENVYANIMVGVNGDFTEKEVSPANIKVSFDANGGNVAIPVKYYSAGSTYGDLPTPTRNGYKFAGWKAENGGAVDNNTVIGLNGYQYDGDYEFTGSNYIDTGVYLFNNDNWQKNCYIELEIKENLSTASPISDMATVMDTKNEGSSPWPGVELRLAGNYTQFRSKAAKAGSSSESKEVKVSSSTKKFKWIRINNILYYSFDSDNFTPMLDFTGFNLQFEVPVTFGAGLTGPGGSPQRYFVGTLSNMKAVFLDDEATLDNYNDHFSYSNRVNLKAGWIVDTMKNFPEFITNKKAQIKEIYFKKENDSDLARYNAINDDTLKGDIGTIGSVKTWLEQDNNDNLYTLYIESSTKTFLTAGQDLFQDFTNLVSIDFTNADTSNLVNMSRMFSGCSNLTSLDLSNFDTSNVINMGAMFDGCNSLTSLNVSSFDTSNVTYMNQMFQDCSSLTSLDLSNFDTSNVISSFSMFRNCSSLTSLNISNFNTSNVEDMHLMFQNCRSLTSLNVSNFNTSNVIHQWGMFRNCSSLTSLDLSNFNTSNVTSMNLMFSGCDLLQTIYVSNLWSLSSVTNSEDMFSGCQSLSGKSSNQVYQFDNSSNDATYAVIATDTQKGYLTDISLKPNNN